jgi:hypothetical protein
MSNVHVEVLQHLQLLYFQQQFKLVKTQIHHKSFKKFLFLAPKVCFEIIFTVPCIHYHFIVFLFFSSLKLEIFLKKPFSQLSPLIHSLNHFFTLKTDDNVKKEKWRNNLHLSLSLPSPSLFFSHFLDCSRWSYWSLGNKGWTSGNVSFLACICKLNFFSFFFSFTFSKACYKKLSPFIKRAIWGRFEMGAFEFDALILIQKKGSYNDRNKMLFTNSSFY